jgi:hypothetical protein
MNSFEYDFSTSIKYHEERLKKCSASFFDAEPRSSQYKRHLQSCINYCLLDNILKRVQSNDPDCYESIINDVNGLFDFLDVVLNLDSSDSFNDLFKEKISTEGVSSLLFVFSLIVSRDSFIRANSTTKCTTRYLSSPAHFFKHNGWLLEPKTLSWS